MVYPDFEEFIASLNAHRARYLIVGAYAVAFHARPRATKDIDVLVDRTAANARRTLGAVSDFLGSPMPNVDVAKMMNPRTLVVLGVAPVRIDLLTSIDGVPSFATAWKQRAEGVFGSTAAHYLGLDDLIAAKAACGRPQDHADLVSLHRASARRAPSKEPRGAG